ncbi:MAG: beta-carotene hydroxylase [Myxococcaceae bacterium]|nr:beta-carotene hydroxylase [Myxococcaceae bacterium]
MRTLLYVAIAVLSFAAMEPLTWAIHRHVMHGFGWAWHRSHHEERADRSPATPPGRFDRLEKNDLFALVFSALGIALFALGLDPSYRACTFVGLGVTSYGAVYFVVHDGICHGRIRSSVWRWVTLRSGYVRRLIQAHRLHHASPGRDGAVSYGFLYARNPRELKRILRARGLPPAQSSPQSSGPASELGARASTATT